MEKRKVNNFKYDCNFGLYTFDDVTVWVDDATEDDNCSDEYSLLDDEIDRLEKMSVQEFLKDSYPKFLEGVFLLTYEQLKGFLTFTRLKMQDLAAVIGYDVGTIKSAFLDNPIVHTRISRFVFVLLEVEMRLRGFCRSVLVNK